MSDADRTVSEPAAIVAGGADDVELIAALIAITATTGTGAIGRHLSGVAPEPAGSTTPPSDPWTTRDRAVAGAPRRTHRWSRVTSHGS